MPSMPLSFSLGFSSASCEGSGGFAGLTHVSLQSPAPPKLGAPFCAFRSRVRIGSNECAIQTIQTSLKLSTSSTKNARSNRDGKHSCSPCYSWQLPRTPMRRSCRPVDREAGSTGTTGGARQMFRAVCMLIRIRDEHLSMFVSMELVDHRKCCPVEIYEICSAIFLYMRIYVPFLVCSDPKKKTNKP